MSDTPSKTPRTDASERRWSFLECGKEDAIKGNTLTEDMAQLEQENATLREQLAEYEAEEAARIASDPAEVLLRESQQRELRWIKDNLALRELADGLAEICQRVSNYDLNGIGPVARLALVRYRAACPGEGKANL